MKSKSTFSVAAGDYKLLEDRLEIIETRLEYRFAPRSYFFPWFRRKKGRRLIVKKGKKEIRFDDFIIFLIMLLQMLLILLHLRNEK